MPAKRDVNWPRASGDFQISKISLHDFEAIYHHILRQYARAELSRKPNAIKLAWIAEVQPITHGLKAQKRLAQGKRSDTLGYELP